MYYDIIGKAVWKASCWVDQKGIRSESWATTITVFDEMRTCAIGFYPRRCSFAELSANHKSGDLPLFLKKRSSGVGSSAEQCFRALNCWIFHRLKACALCCQNVGLPLKSGGVLELVRIGDWGDFLAIFYCLKITWNAKAFLHDFALSPTKLCSKIHSHSLCEQVLKSGKDDSQWTKNQFCH